MRRLCRGGPREHYSSRDEQGLAVDFVVPRKAARLTLLECKVGRSVAPSMAAPFEKLRAADRKRRPRAPTRALLVYQSSPTEVRPRALLPGTSAPLWNALIDER